MNTSFRPPTAFSSTSAAALGSAGFDRRNTPRMAPLSVDLAPAFNQAPPRDSTLEELKTRRRKPGEASFFYRDHHFQHNAVKVLPGEYFVANENLVIMTVLGSCIAACVWDSRTRLGGMNHFMLPEGDGAQVMHNFTSMNVGERNTKFVVNYLQTERIPIVSEDVLDIYPRKVVFFPVTGKVMVKRLAHTHPETIVAQEVRGNAATVAKTTAGGSVDLF